MNRDITIDCLRSFAMLQVLLVHVLKGNFLEIIYEND